MEKRDLRIWHQLLKSNVKVFITRYDQDEKSILKHFRDAAGGTALTQGLKAGLTVDVIECSDLISSWQSEINARIKEVVGQNYL